MRSERAPDADMQERSILARLMAYAMWGFTDEEFCSDDQEGDFDRLTFLQMADVALDYLAAHDAAVREEVAVAVSAEVVRMQREVMSGNYQDANEIHEDLGRIAAIARGDA